jgi:hypothetical protein
VGLRIYRISLFRLLSEDSQLAGKYKSLLRFEDLGGSSEHVVGDKLVSSSRESQEIHQVLVWSVKHWRGLIPLSD